MLERKPLTEIQNGSSTRRKTRTTYGKKGKASAALRSAQDIFTMADQIEEKFAQIKIEEEHQKKNIETSVSTKESLQASEDFTTTQKTSESQEASQASVLHLKRKDPALSSRVSDVIPLTDIPDEDEQNPTGRFTRRDDQFDKFVQQNSEYPILAFHIYGNRVSKAYNVEKIGEGTYSSVFALTPKQSVSGKSQSSSKNPILPKRTTIIKLMPILFLGDEPQDGVTEPFFVANETQIMKLMDPIHGFLRYRGLTICRGHWPESFINAFRDFAKKNKKKAENEDPVDIYNCFQHYALIEMEDAGMEISDIKRPSYFQVYDIFWMTAIHLANAEAMRDFEHRDLHTSNICVKPRNSLEQRLNVTEEVVSSMTEVPKHLLGMSNISVTIIDYTYSRVSLASMQGDTTSAATQFAGRHTAYREFKVDDSRYDDLVENEFIWDEDITRKKKDSKGNTKEEKIEFEERVQMFTYFRMGRIIKDRYKALVESNQHINPDTFSVIAPWETSSMKTNVCWLGYLAGSLLSRAGKQARTKYIKGSNEVAEVVQDEMRSAMIEVRELLLQDDVEQLPESAGALVDLAVEKGWLMRDDIRAFKEILEQDSD